MRTTIIALIFLGLASRMKAAQKLLQIDVDSIVAHCQVFRQSDSLRQWLDCYWEQADAWFDSTALSLAILDRAVANMWREVRNEAEAEGLMWVHLSRGWQRFQQGDVPASIDAYEAAQQLYMTFQLTDFPVCEYLYKPLGSHYIRLGDNQRARLVLMKALDACPDESAEVIGGLMNNIALSYWNESRYEEAAFWFRKGLSLPDLPALQRSMLSFGLAQTLFDQGQYAQAQQYLAHAEKILPSQGTDSRYDDLRSRLFLLKARLAYRTGQDTPRRIAQWLARSASFCQKAYPHTFHRTLGKIKIVQGELALDQGQLGQAELLFRQVLEGMGALAAHALVLLVDNTVAEAWDGLARVWQARFRQQPTQQAARQALHALAQAQRIEYALRQMLVFESSQILRQQLYRQRTAQALELLTWLNQTQADTAAAWQALEWMERSRAVVLAETVSSLNNMRDSTTREWARLRRHLAYYEQQLIQHPEQTEFWLQRQRELTQELDSLAAQSDYLSIGAFHLQPLSDSLLQAQVGMHGAMCYYFQAPQALYRCRWTGPSTLVLEVLPLPAMGNLLDWLRRPDGGARHPLLDSLRLQLLPLEVAGKERLLVLPDGALHYLPFSLLVTDSLGLPAIPTQYAFSLAVLSLSAQPRLNEGKLATGWAPFVSKGRDGLAALPYTQQEIGTLPKGYTPFIGSAATLAAFRQMASRSELIHLATHATGEDSSGLPRIELADSSLFMTDLYRMELRAALVVLSACETFTGAEISGEGVMGLARAFAYAGARGLVASLWQVNDATTAHLWQAFYRYLEQGIPPARALWRAQRDFLTTPGRPDYQRTPYYWAAFIYLGPEQVVALPSAQWHMYWALLGGLLVVLVFMSLFWASTPKK